MGSPCSPAFPLLNHMGRAFPVFPEILRMCATKGNT